MQVLLSRDKIDERVVKDLQLAPLEPEEVLDALSDIGTNMTPCGRSTITAPFAAPLTASPSKTRSTTVSDWWIRFYKRTARY